MANEMTRRDVMKTGLAAAVLGAAGTFDWVLPALAQGEVVVPFTDSHQNFNPNPAPDRRLFDTRTLIERVHAEGSVLHHPALRPSRDRSGRVPAEGIGPGELAARVVAR